MVIMWMLTLVLEEQGKEGLEEGSLVGMGMGPRCSQAAGWKAILGRKRFGEWSIQHSLSAGDGSASVSSASYRSAHFILTRLYEMLYLFFS